MNLKVAHSHSYRHQYQVSVVREDSEPRTDHFYRNPHLLHHLDLKKADPFVFRNLRHTHLHLHHLILASRSSALADSETNSTGNSSGYPDTSFEL